MNLYLKPAILIFLLFTSFIINAQIACSDERRLNSDESKIAKVQIEPIQKEIVSYLMKKIAEETNNSLKAQYEKDQTVLGRFYKDFKSNRTNCNQSAFHFIAEEIATRNHLTFSIEFTTKKTGARIMYRSFDGNPIPCDQLTIN